MHYATTRNQTEHVMLLLLDVALSRSTKPKQYVVEPVGCSTKPKNTTCGCLCWMLHTHTYGTTRNQKEHVMLFLLDVAHTHTHRNQTQHVVEPVGSCTHTTIRPSRMMCFLFLTPPLCGDRCEAQERQHLEVNLRPKWGELTQRDSQMPSGFLRGTKESALFFWGGS